VGSQHISARIGCPLFFSVEDFFDISCVEPSRSVAATPVNGLKIIPVEDKLSILVTRSK
jgi:hypothetical protein